MPTTCWQAQCNQHPFLSPLVGRWTTTSWRNYHQEFSVTPLSWNGCKFGVCLISVRNASKILADISSVVRDPKRVFIAEKHLKLCELYCFPSQIVRGLVMVGLRCELSWPSRSMCYGAGRPSKLFEFLFTLSFLLRATNATRRRGKLSERHIADYDLCFSRV